MNFSLLNFMQVTEPSINTSGLIVIWDLHNSRVKFQAWENKQVNWALFVLGAYYNDSPICYPLIYSAQSLCLNNIIAVLMFITYRIVASRSTSRLETPHVTNWINSMGRQKIKVVRCVCQVAGISERSNDIQKSFVPKKKKSTC